MRARFVNLGPDELIKEIIANCTRLAKLKALLIVGGVNELVVETLRPVVTNDPWFWTLIVKFEQEEPVDLRNYSV